MTAHLGLDHDWRLRFAAFAALTSLSEPRGGYVTREEMTNGFLFDGQRIPFADQRRGIWRPAVLRDLGIALSITTASLRKNVPPKYDDQIASEEGWFEYRYQGENPEDWDNVAVRRAYELGRPIIYFYGVSPGNYEAIFPAYVIGDEPNELTFRIAADATGIGDLGIQTGGSAAPLKAYATATVKRRLHQHRFRAVVMRAYSERCTICRLAHSELLDAAHILEDRDELGRPEVQNGLSLCRIHHGAYDTNILGIDPDYRIHIRRDILDEIDGPMLQHGLQGTHGLAITPPRREQLRPNRDYLQARFEKFRAT